GKALTKTVKKNGAEITKFIQEQFSNRFNGAMIRQSKTWNGMMSNLGDSWVDFQRRIGESGFFQIVKDRLGNLVDFLGRMDANGSLDRWATSIGNAMSKTFDAAVYFGDRIRRHFGFLTSFFDVNPAIFTGIA